MNHNTIDSTVMSNILGMKVLAQDFTLEEDHSKILADGVTWRRRRFLFCVQNDDDTQSRPEALCINEVTLDSDAKAEISPCLASEYSHLTDFSEIENAYWATTFAAGALRSGKGVKESRLYLNLAKIFYDKDSTDYRQTIHRLSSLDGPCQVSEEIGELFEMIEHKIAPQNDGKFGVARYLPAFPASRLVQACPEILAATNAGFFLNFPEEYNDGVSCLHQPVGGHMVDGDLVVPCWIQRPGVLYFKNGRSRSSLFGPEDMELTIGEKKIKLFRGQLSDKLNGSIWRHFDKQLPEQWPDDAVLLNFTGKLLTKIEPANPNVKPMLGGAMVCLTGEDASAALQPDACSEISIGLRIFPEGTPHWLISSGPFLVEKAAVVSPSKMLTNQYAGEFGPGGMEGPPPTRFPFDTAKTRAPRTAFGVLPSGGLKIVVVDGRRSGEHSCGVTLDGMAALMQNVGCESAINFDGGGSSVMAIEGVDLSDMLRENSPYGVVNIPSDDNGNERILPIFLIVRGKAK